MNPASLTEAWKRLREGLLRDHPDIDEETLSDTLDGITGAKDAIRRLIRNAVEDAAQADGLDNYIDALKARKDRIMDRSKARRAAAMAMLQEIGESKIDSPEFVATVGHSKGALRILDEKLLPPWALKPSDPVPDGKLIRAVLAEGKDVPGATMTNGEPFLTVRPR
jgi:hypothetical protein